MFIRLATSGTVLSAPSANSVQPTTFRVSDFLEEGRIFRNDPMSALLARGGCTNQGPLVRLMSVRYVPGGVAAISRGHALTPTLLAPLPATLGRMPAIFFLWRRP